MKYAAFLEIEEEVTKKVVSKKLNVPKNTLSTWKKNRYKIVTALKSSGGTKTQWIKERTKDKSAKPRCFKNVKSLPCCYQSQEKSCMNSSLFVEWVNELNKKYKKENCKVILIVDNCRAHPIIESLKVVELVFLPINTTSKAQPMDHGVIDSLRIKYHKKSFKGWSEQ